MSHYYPERTHHVDPTPSCTVSRSPEWGKYSFTPYLAKGIGASVLDTDKLFDAPRIAVGAALGLGTQVADEPQ